jgi:phage shock protein E
MASVTMQWAAVVLALSLSAHAEGRPRSLRRRPAPVLLDVRTQAEWDAGHISCAHLLPVQDDPSLIAQVRQLMAGGDLTAPVVTYCHSGVRAGRAAEALRSAGFTYVRNGGGYAIPPTNTAALERLCIPPGPLPSVTVGAVSLPMVVMGTGSGQKGEVDNATKLWLGSAGGRGIDTA